MSTDKDPVASKLAQALALGGAQDYRAAYALLDEVLAEHPQHSDALRAKGNILDLEASLEAPAGHEPDPSDPRLLQASRLYEKALLLEPDNALTLIDVAESRARGGKIHAAIQAASRAIHLLRQESLLADQTAADLVSAHRTRLQILLEAGRTVEAQAAKEEALNDCGSIDEITRCLMQS